MTANICDYCGKPHHKPTGSYCPERTIAWQKGIGQGVLQKQIKLDLAGLFEMFRRIRGGR